MLPIAALAPSSYVIVLICLLRIIVGLVTFSAAMALKLPLSRSLRMLSIRFRSASSAKSESPFIWVPFAFARSVMAGEYALVVTERAFGKCLI